MVQRLRLVAFLAGMASIPLTPLISQTAPQTWGSTDTAVFKANARIVVLDDVVMTGKNFQV